MKSALSRTRVVIGIALFLGMWMFSSVTTGFYDLGEAEITKQKFVPRHKTTFEIRGTNYIYHKTSYDRRDKKHLIEDDINRRHRLTEEWRPHLMAKRGMLGLQRPEDTEVFRKLQPGDTFDEKCGSCAVISNTDLLLGSGLGAQIDKTDCVFRFGSAPTAQYSKDIGRKSTVRLVEMHSFENSTESRQAKNIFINRCETDEICEKVTIKNSNEQHLKPKVFYLTENGQNTAKKMFQLQNLASGHSEKALGPSEVWYSLMLIKHAKCKKVKMYGFPPPYFCRNKRNHSYRIDYWKENSRRICSSMDENSKSLDLPSLEEKKLLLQWAWKYRLNFQQPKW
ncbi:Alpha-N-acetylgalactosaminide alpha-2,6-sialyltransferase 5 [Nymphon striatum]|nr:Alpha-N-acetylgalactosaminide alpha-2,6-sialyltransferase 5 [Nymphon striatum]